MILWSRETDAYFRNYKYDSDTHTLTFPHGVVSYTLDMTQFGPVVQIQPDNHGGTVLCLFGIEFGYIEYVHYAGDPAYLAPVKRLTMGFFTRKVLTLYQNDSIVVYDRHDSGKTERTKIR